MTYGKFITSTFLTASLALLFVETSHAGRYDGDKGFVKTTGEVVYRHNFKPTIPQVVPLEPISVIGHKGKNNRYHHHFISREGHGHDAFGHKVPAPAMLWSAEETEHALKNSLRPINDRSYHNKALDLPNHLYTGSVPAPLVHQGELHENGLWMDAVPVFRGSISVGHYEHSAHHHAHSPIIGHVAEPRDKWDDH